MFDNLENDLAPNLVQSVTNKSCWCWLLQTGADTPMLHTAATLPLQLQSKGRNASSLVKDQEMVKLIRFKISN